ncbi:sulfotransferase family 2 domain-containing protein [Limimaricola pyoseonensis]|uniref:Sulfotransferase family protein n=1 Tax=Limimaricola pyoseonensis TaxID=521013 RepID=A0A1G7IZD4_9RHOB|nr:sulfotransferase family 2 domain-containing protein [Limimaricola pyoseonensis]SDF17956.1 Sulfotransferase family protein [Limimaricola pyoseonensis]
MLDNRTLLDKTGLAGLQRGIDRARGVGRNHFMIEIAGRRLGYCYIRKNACSSFKRMFLDLAPPDLPRRPDERPIDFMRRHFRMTPEDFERCDHLVLVHREPLARLLSMFRNKFVAETGAQDITRSFERLEGRPAAQASFRDFATRYLARDFARIDRHVLPQRLHLARAVYTDVIPISDLHDRMAAILGPDLAARYFARPVNRSSHVPLVAMPGAAERPVAELRRLYAETGTMPDDDSLLPPDLRARLLARYAMDRDLAGPAAAARPA